MTKQKKASTEAAARDIRRLVAGGIEIHNPGRGVFEISLRLGFVLGVVLASGIGWAAPASQYNMSLQDKIMTAVIRGRPWKFSLQYWNYVVSPDVFGPNHQIRISVSPVVQLPW